MPLRSGVHACCRRALSSVADLSVVTVTVPYVDLNDAARTPFTALGGREAGPRDRHGSKHDSDYELWNRLGARAARRRSSGRGARPTDCLPAPPCCPNPCSRRT